MSTHHLAVEFFEVLADRGVRIDSIKSRINPAGMPLIECVASFDAGHVTFDGTSVMDVCTRLLEWSDCLVKSPLGAKADRDIQVAVLDEPQ